MGRNISLCLKECCDTIKRYVNEQECFIGCSSKHIWGFDKFTNSCQKNQSNPFWACGLMGRRSPSLLYSVGSHSLPCTGNRGLLHDKVCCWVLLQACYVFKNVCVTDRFEHMHPFFFIYRVYLTHFPCKRSDSRCLAIMSP